jgi:hypothetical protein
MVRPFLLAMAATLPIVAASLGSGCESVTVQPGDGGEGGSGGFLFLDGGGGTHLPVGGHGPDSGLPDFMDPGCGDPLPPLQDFQCDPYDQFNGDCMAGEGCYIYVQYPSEPCGQEIYGALCLPAGMGEQGASCSGGQQCAPGHVCVITGSGTQCVHLCSLTGKDGCPPGLVCEPIDVEGFGGCL